MADIDPGAEQEASFFSQYSLGPEEIAARITGVAPHGKRKDDGPYITNNDGAPYPDSAHSKNVGGVPVLSDQFLLEQLQRFNRSKKAPGRVAHSAGSGACGYFECTKDMSELTKADLYNEVEKRTPIFMRFSTAFLSKESPDQGPSPHGFAIKHYTKDGNYDIVGLNWPIFFCRDPMQGPDVFQSQQRNPENFLDYNVTFDFLANVPESNHAAMMLFSNHGHPNGWRKMNGYGCHTFKWVNKEGQFVYVKYHFICDQGSEQLTWGEAKKKYGDDPDFFKKDLWEAIEKGEPVTWTAKVQVMKPEQADAAKLGFDPFDVTKIWPRTKFPMQSFGRLVLEENANDNHVEQAAFSPGSMVSGIEESTDMLLQARMFLYRDAQYHRLGVDFHQIRVNCPFMSCHGPASMGFGGSGNAHYASNSSVSKFRPDTAEAPYEVSDNIVSRQSHYFTECTHKEYDQARELYDRVMSKEARADLHDNTAALLKLVEYPNIQIRYLAQCYCINPEYAQAIYNLLPKPEFDFRKVRKIAEDAPSFGKERKFMPFGENHRLVGNPATIPTYQK